MVCDDGQRATRSLCHPWELKDEPRTGHLASAIRLGLLAWIDNIAETVLAVSRVCILVATVFNTQRQRPNGGRQAKTNRKAKQQNTQTNLGLFVLAQAALWWSLSFIVNNIHSWNPYFRPLHPSIPHGSTKIDFFNFSKFNCRRFILSAY